MSGLEDETALDLHYQWLGGGSAAGMPLVFLHGMLGTGRNLLPVARALRECYAVLLPDLRNHGASPDHPRMDYPAMAADLERLLDRLSIDRCRLVGHSMGGKAAMYLALTRPRRVAALAVLDMAPVEYPPRFGPLFDALRDLDLSEIASRRDVQRILLERIGDSRLAAFLVQGLEREGAGWRWRFNPQVIRNNGNALRAFPKLPSYRQFAGRSLFLHGDRSDYMKPDYWPAVLERFPGARSRAIAGAGHWLHADRPQEVAQALAEFFAL